MAEADPTQSIPTVLQLPSTSQQQYQMQAPLIQALDWLLSNPSIPLSFKNQFHMMWENVTFGNYESKDILFLMSKFREWSILLTWYIPEQKWGNIHEFSDDKKETTALKMDLNLLLNSLESLFFIQLTRGKDGFTVKELTTFRHKSTTEIDTKQEKKGGIRLF